MEIPGVTTCNQIMLKRLFFGVEVHAPWPQEFPGGRLLNEAHRHMTIAFLGNVNDENVIKILPELPSFPLQIGLAGQFNECLFLPPNKSRVVAWHIDWFEDSKPLLNFQKSLVAFLQSHHIPVDDRKDFLPHVTICRAPFVAKQWKQDFSPLPCFIKNLHLYESMGNLNYESRWNIPVKAPFEEIDHTADIAFIIRGNDLNELSRHAQLALAFRFPPLLSYFSKMPVVKSLEDIIIGLNEIVTMADGDIGCPLKAISFHGEIQNEEHSIIWEMIVDV